MGANASLFPHRGGRDFATQARELEIRITARRSGAVDADGYIPEVLRRWMEPPLQREQALLRELGALLLGHRMQDLERSRQVLARAPGVNALVTALERIDQRRRGR